MDLVNQKVLVVGMARSGIAAAELLLKHGAIPVLSDQKPESAFGDKLDSLRGTACIFRLGEDSVQLLETADLLVISPGVPITAPVVRCAAEKGIPTVGELELASALLAGDLLAISGTNGKTTTTTLLGKIFENAGRVSHVAGNIGYPLSWVAAEAKEEDVTVAEVSSFQLESISGFHPRTAALLNITEDHLNRHGTMAEYIRMKKRLFENQTAEDYAVLNLDDPILREMRGSLPSRVVFFSRNQPVENGMSVENGTLVWRWMGERTPVCEADEILIPGPHNLENALAAAAMAMTMGVEPSVIRRTLRTFEGVEHRIETVRTLNGITYINDSKGTNVDSTIKAVQSMKAPTVIILGGYDKHTDFMPLCLEINHSGLISHAVVIGATADQICSQLSESGFQAITRACSMQEAVEKAKALALPGGNVLLSPACASFDMFSDYEQRGSVFKQIVHSL